MREDEPRAASGGFLSEASSALSTAAAPTKDETWGLASETFCIDVSIDRLAVPLIDSCCAAVSWTCLTPAMRLTLPSIAPTAAESCWYSCCILSKVAWICLRTFNWSSEVAPCKAMLQGYLSHGNYRSWKPTAMMDSFIQSTVGMKTNLLIITLAFKGGCDKGKQRSPPSETKTSWYFGPSSP